jgi:hypothetical protein
VVTPRPTVVHRVGSSLAHHSSSAPTAALHIEFSGGKACDIEDTLRGATMEITCGKRCQLPSPLSNQAAEMASKTSSKIALATTYSRRAHASLFPSPHLSTPLYLCPTTQIASTTLCLVDGFAPPTKNVLNPPRPLLLTSFFSIRSRISAVSPLV